MVGLVNPHPNFMSMHVLAPLRDWASLVWTDYHIAGGGAGLF